MSRLTPDITNNRRRGIGTLTASKPCGGITGRGGLYFDEGQIGWELVFERATLGAMDLAEVTRRICEGRGVGPAETRRSGTLPAAQ